MDAQRARELVAGERARIERALADLGDETRADSLGRQQPGDSGDAGSALLTESMDQALTVDFHDQLAAVERAEERIAAGAYGKSIESGLPIPDERLEAEPLAERTIEEQMRYEAHGAN